MSWLDDRLITYVYLRPDGEEIHKQYPANKEPPKTYKGGKYHGFLPEKTNMTFKVAFEMNGRKGYKYDTGEGKPRIVSATRERYEHTMGNTPAHKLKSMPDTEKTKTVYSRSFEKHLNEQKKGKK